MELDFVKVAKNYKYAVYATKSKNKLGATGKWSITKKTGLNSYVTFSMTADNDLHFNLFGKASKPEIIFKKIAFFILHFCIYLMAKVMWKF